MFNFFSKNKRVLGLDIKPTYIRFVEIVRTPDEDHVSSYGEVTFEEVVIKDDVVVNESLLVSYLRDIKKNIKAHETRVSLPEGANSRVFRDVLRKAGFKHVSFVNLSVALEKALVPNGSETSFLLVDAEVDAVNFLVYKHDEKTLFYRGDSANHSVISNINRIYIDWYDSHKEKLHYILFSGSRTKSSDFLDYVSRETKLEIKKGNIMVNLHLDPEKVPIIIKDDSYKYAVATGLALQ